MRALPVGPRPAQVGKLVQVNVYHRRGEQPRDKGNDQGARYRVAERLAQLGADHTQQYDAGNHARLSDNSIVSLAAVAG